MIARRQRPGFINYVHQHLGPHGGQTFARHAIFRQDGFARRNRHVERGLIVDFNALGAAHRNGFQVFGPHNGAHARPPGGPVQVIHNTRKLNAVFTGLPDGRDTYLRVLVFGLKALFRFPHRASPIMGRVNQGGDVVLDQEIHGLFRFAFKDNHVPAREFKLGPEETAGVGTRDGTGERTLGDHRPATAGGRRRSGQRTGGNDQFVIGRKRIDLGIDFFRQVFGGQATLP